MRFTVKRITPFLLYRADSRKDLLCKGNHKPSEQAQEALGSLAGVVALDRHTDLDDAPAEDNNADSLDRRKEVGTGIMSIDRIRSRAYSVRSEMRSSVRNEA